MKRGAPWWATGHDYAKLRRMLRERTIPPMARRHRWWVMRRVHWPQVIYTGTRLMVSRKGRPWPVSERAKYRPLWSEVHPKDSPK